MEKNLKDVELNIERGFDDKTRIWNYKRFVENQEEPDVYLYKLHGSIDWKRDSGTEIVKTVDSIPDEPDLIFGTQYKMQYIDPYLFMISEFRHYCLKAKLIVCLGYSFSDEHINGILKQSLSFNKTAKVFSLAYKEDKDRIANKILSIESKRITIITDKTAKEFFEKDLKLEYFYKLFPENDDGVL